MTIAAIIAYFIILALIGWLAYRKINGSTDQYFVAGRGLGTFVNSWAFLASLASGGSVLASVGTGLSLGLPYGASLIAGAPVGFVVASVLVARPLRKLGKYTVPDYFRSRYRSAAMAWAVPIIIIIGSLAYMVAQLKAAAIVAEYALGWDYSLSVIITGLVFILYVSVGGFLAVSWNDVFQGILMFCVIVAFGLTVFLSVDSFAGSFGATVDKFPSLSATGVALPIPSYIGGFLTWAVAISVLAHVIMRVYSSKNVRSAKVSLNVSMILFGVMMLIASVILTGAAAEVPGITADTGDEAFLLLTEHFLAPAVQGVVAAAILAAVMSTTAGLLMVCNAAVSHDIYSRILRPHASERNVVRVASIATWVIGIVAVLFALNPPEFLVVLYTAAVGFMASSFFFPMVLGIWWRRCTNAGGVAGLSGGAVSFAAMFVLFDAPASTEILVGLPTSLVLTVIVSLVTKEQGGSEAFSTSRSPDAPTPSSPRM